MNIDQLTDEEKREALEAALLQIEAMRGFFEEKFNSLCDNIEGEDYAYYYRARHQIQPGPAKELFIKDIAKILPFENFAQGEEEREAIDVLIQKAQEKATRRPFFAVKKAGKIKFFDEKKRPRPVAYFIDIIEFMKFIIEKALQKQTD